MATASVRLYQATELYNDRNYIIDDIESFLSEKTFETIELVTYFKHQLHASLKLQVPQSHLNYFDTRFKYTYLSIQNVDGLTAIDTYPVYYYITNKTWRSTETIEYTLEMDVLNTFTEERGNFTFSNKTLVIREMRDRFKRVSTSKFIRKVDDVDEGLTPELILNSNDVYDGILKENYDDLDWYLVYKMKNLEIDFNVDPRRYENLPLYVELQYTNRETNNVIWNNTIKPPVNASDVNANKNYFTSYEVTGAYMAVDTDGGVYTTNPNARHGKYTDGFIIYSNGSTFTVRTVKRNDDGTVTTKLASTGHAITLDGNIGNNVVNLVEVSPNYERWSQFINSTERYPLPYLSAIKDQTFDIYDRQDPFTIKVMRYPYCPIEMFKDSDGTYYPNVKWRYMENGAETEEMNKRLYNDRMAEFENEIIFNKYPFSEMTERLEDFGTPQMNRVPENESKMLNSAYHYNKLSLDSFSKVFRNECFKELEATEANYAALNSQLKVLMKASNSGGHAILFKIPQYKTPYMSSEDFNDILIVNRNNDEVMFTSNYLDYVDKYYDTDKAHNKYQMFADVFSGLLNPAQFSTTAGAITSGGKMGMNWVDRDISIWRNLKNAMLQGASMTGCDDADIFKFITKNRLLLTKYDLKPKDYTFFNNLFYYTGYLTNQIKMPNHNTRMYFDYLQCALDTSVLYNIPEECKTALKEKFSNGVTYFHKDSNGNYDINQIYENWERNL